MSRKDAVFLIAEAGVNHNGSVDLALKLVDAAARAGADAVKFQTFSAEKLASRIARKANYQAARTGRADSQLGMLRALELDREAHHALAKRAADRGIEFMSSAFDEESLDFLVHALRIRRIKVPSGEITNAKYLLHVANHDKPVLLSTGMSTLEEVQAALGILAFGYLRQAATPSAQAFAAAGASAEGRRHLEQKVTLLHCTSEYPAPVEHVNLRAMDTLAEACGLAVGYSDHTEGASIAIGAVARGARVLEKHLTLDRAMRGPDHAASLDPDAFKVMVRSIREVVRALGAAEKAPAPGELDTREVARRSLVAGASIRKGDRFDAANLAVKRPGTGISAIRYWEWLGRSATRDYAEDEMIEQ